MRPLACRGPRVSLSLSLSIECFVLSGRGIARFKHDGTRAENRFRLSPKRTSPFKSAGDSVQSTAGSRGVGISGSNAGYTMFRGSVKSTGYPLHSPVSPSLPLPCVTVCHQVSNALYLRQADPSSRGVLPSAVRLALIRCHSTALSFSSPSYSNQKHIS